MTSTIKVNNVQNQCGQNIINENSNTITIGASGDTVALASGASQTGFGRSGSVNYQTSIKTTNFTAVSGEGYFVDTSSGAITVTLPSSPSAGSIVAIVDYAGTSGNNKITIGRNGSNVEGSAVDGEISTNREAKTLVYADATQGWVSVADNTTETQAAAYIAATGGTVSTVCTDFKVHTFTGPGTFCVSNVGNSAGSNKVSYVIVAGGGGGGYEGGGGAGGFRESRAPTCSYSSSPIAITGSCGGVTVSSGPNAIVVGGGASGITSSAPALAKGNVSSALGLTAAGGGGGKNSGTPVTNACGGSGGGGASSGPLNAGAAGNIPSVSPAQGFPGGNYLPAGNPGASVNTAGGGGGATARGFGLACTDSGNGGAGASTSITGSSVARAGGGGGGVNPPSPAKPGGTGGGGEGRSGAGESASANTGGGGGGSWNNTGGNGGSGIVVIRYKFQN
tara:strand:+ start:292 stop:1641 length:1350 start_codon:yes stop_codon:yes gene_type:complete